MMTLQILRKHIQSKHKSGFAELLKLSIRALKRKQPLQDGDTTEQPSTCKHGKIDSYMKERIKVWLSTDKRQQDWNETPAQMICF